MANENEIEFKVRVKQDGVSELASDLNKVDGASKDLADSSKATGEALEKMGDGARDAGADVKSLGTSIDSKTAAIRASLQAEQSEIAIQQQLLNAAKAEQQARLQSAKARGDQTAAAQASKAIIALEADQSQLLAQRLRNEATAIQAATDARREQLAAVGPLTQAQQQELLASENQAKALRVQAAAADTSSQHTRELSTNVQQLEKRSQALNTELTSVAKALGGLFAAVNLGQFAKDAITTADAYGQMAERIQMASKGSEEYELVQKRLLETANLTYRPLVEQQEMYIQTAAALRSLSYTTKDVLDITDSFSYLLTTNAASADKGRSAIDAYSKSIQTGKVEADAWTSIMSAMPTIVDAIAASTGKTASEIRNLGVTGALSIADLNEGLRQTVETNKELASGMSATVKDAVTRLANTWSVYIGEANRAHKGTDQIVKLIDQVSSNLDSVVRAATAVGEVMVVVWAVKALGALKSYTTQLVLATKETQALMTATAAGGVQMAAALKAAGNVALSAWVGWEIGTYLKAEFQVVEQAGIALAAGLTKTAARAQAGWEMMKAAFTSDTIEAAMGRLQVRLQQIDDEYAQLFADADRSAKKQEEHAKSTTTAAIAAQNATVRWEGLRTSYAEVNKEVEAMAAQVDKNATLRNAEAAAVTAMAAAFGTERDQRLAAAEAAEVQAQQSANIAKQRQMEVEVLKAERDALMAVGAELVKSNPEKQKQLDDLNKQIALREADAGAATAQATASKIAAVAAQAEFNAYKDNSARVGELRDAYEQARQKLEEVRAAKTAGKATTEELTEAELNAGKAARAYKDALADQLQAIEAKMNVTLQDNDLQQSQVQLAIAVQQRIYEVAKARGDEATATRAANEIKRLEIELLTLTAQAKRAEADAAMAGIQVKKAELIANGEYNGVKKLELDAAVKAAEAKRVEADIADVTAAKLRDLAAAQQQLKGDTDDATSSINKQSKALNGLNESKTSGSQFIWTQSSIVDYLKQAGLEESIAADLSKQFLNPNGDVNYEASQAQLQWGGQFSTLSSALGKMVEYYKYGDGKQTYDQMVAKNAKAEEASTAGTATSTSSKPSAPTASGSTSSGKSTSSGLSTGNTYVSNITLNGKTTSVKFADAASQSSTEQLLRDLLDGKGVSQ